MPQRTHVYGIRIDRGARAEFPALMEKMRWAAGRPPDLGEQQGQGFQSHNGKHRQGIDQ